MRGARQVADFFQGANRLDEFRRAPLDHRRYLSFMAHLKKEHGLVMDFIRERRVKWTDIKPSGAAVFQNPRTPPILDNSIDVWCSRL
jgi:hypothetical protein